MLHFPATVIIMNIIPTLLHTCSNKISKYNIMAHEDCEYGHNSHLLVEIVIEAPFLVGLQGRTRICRRTYTTKRGMTCARQYTTTQCIRETKQKWDRTGKDCTDPTITHHGR